MPSPPLEAAAAGIPVICSNTTSMEDFSFFGKGHIDPFNYEQLKNALNSIIHQPADRTELAGIAETIRQKYSWQHSAEMLYQLVINDIESR